MTPAPPTAYVADVPASNSSGTQAAAPFFAVSLLKLAVLSLSANHDPNARFSAWNWVTIAVGGCLLVLSIIGALVLKQ